MPERPYEKLIAWQETFRLCLDTYKVTTLFPPEEKFGLTSQMRRAAASIPINIAEGNAKRTSKDKMHYLDIALGSLEELHCQYRIALGLQYLTEELFRKADEHCHRASYLINKLRSSL